jgi:hypothetical protein
VLRIPLLALDVGCKLPFTYSWNRVSFAKVIEQLLLPFIEAYLGNVRFSSDLKEAVVEWPTGRLFDFYQHFSLAIFLEFQGTMMAVRLVPWLSKQAVRCESSAPLADVGIVTIAAESP